MVYMKADGEQTDRTVVTLTDVPEFVRTHDITGLDQADMDYLLTKRKEYAEYVENFMRTMFNFETWYEHTTAQPLPEKLTKYRNFSLHNINLIEELEDK